jgi:murein DD-endopeptidase MepM/ murein hydrolase activator NlpD
MLLVGLALVGHLRAQQVIVGREDTEEVETPPRKAQPTVSAVAPQPATAKQEFPKPPVVKENVIKVPLAARSTIADKPKPQSSPALIMIAKAPAGPALTKPQSSPAKAPATAATSTAVPVRPTGVIAGMPDRKSMRLTRVEGPAPEHQPELPVGMQDSGKGWLKLPLETAFVRLADGFDFPVGKPDAQGYYKARGFRSRGHLGEDWDGLGGGDTDLGDPIFSIGGGVVVFARDCHMGWGNVIIIRHSYRDGGTVRSIDSLYGHLDRMLVRRGQMVSRGQQIATMGNAHGLYDAHLHLEIRKNLEIGMSRAAFAQDFSNYYDPTQFIEAHRHLQGGGTGYRVAMNTFTRDSRINWSAVRNFSHSRHRSGTRESAVALKKAVATTKN